MRPLATHSQASLTCSRSELSTAKTQRSPAKSSSDSSHRSGHSSGSGSSSDESDEPRGRRQTAGATAPRRGGRRSSSSDTSSDSGSGSSSPSHDEGSKHRARPGRSQQMHGNMDDGHSARDISPTALQSDAQSRSFVRFETPAAMATTTPPRSKSYLNVSKSKSEKRRRVKPSLSVPEDSEGRAPQQDRPRTADAAANSSLHPRRLPKLHAATSPHRPASAASHVASAHQRPMSAGDTAQPPVIGARDLVAGGSGLDGSGLQRSSLPRAHTFSADNLSDRSRAQSAYSIDL